MGREKEKGGEEWEDGEGERNAVLETISSANGLTGLQIDHKGRTRTRPLLIVFPVTILNLPSLKPV